MESKQLVRLASIQDGIHALDGAMGKAEVLGDMGLFGRLLDVKRCIRKREDEEKAARKITTWEQWRKEHNDANRD